MKKYLILLMILCLFTTEALAGSGIKAAILAKNRSAGGGSENIGNTSNGGDTQAMADDYMYCVRLTSTPAHDGSVDSITFTGVMAGDASGSVYLSIYTNGSAKPGTLVANSNVGPIEVTYNGGAAHDITYNYTGTKPSVTSGATYWVCVNNDGTTINTSFLYTFGSGTCAGTGYCSVTEANAHNNFPADWSAITPDFENDGLWRGKLYFTYSY